MTIWIFTNGRPSNGAKALSSQPGFKRCILGKGIKPGDTLVNWGNTQAGAWFGVPKILNACKAIRLASNKLDYFQYLFGPESPDPYVQTVEFTSLKQEAQKWQDEGCVVVCRLKLTGHSGDGIVIVEPGEVIPDAPLYTKYIFKEKEYRVHVVDGKVIDTQRKIKDPSREVLSWKVRSHQNGFIFARNNIESCSTRDELAVAAIQCVGLDFGAVDIIQDKKGKYYVLEVNTAPGLEGQTVERYAEAFRNWGQ